MAEVHAKKAEEAPKVEEVVEEEPKVEEVSRPTTLGVAHHRAVNEKRRFVRTFKYTTCATCLL